MKNTLLLLSTTLFGALSCHAANTFTLLTLNSDGTNTLPMFSTPGLQETAEIITGATSGTVVFDMEQSNVGPAFPATGINPQTTFTFHTTGTGTVALRVTEITGWNEHPYRWDFITSGDISSFSYTISFSSSFKALDSANSNTYTIAQRALVDPNGDGIAQNFQSTIYAYDETLSLIDLAAQPNLETPFITMPFSDGTGTATVISHTDTNFTNLLPDGGFATDPLNTHPTTLNTLNEQVLSHGWASTGNGIKSLDSTDRQALDFGKLSGSFEAFTTSGAFDSGTIFAITTNGTFTSNSVAVPEPSSVILASLSLLLLIIRKR